MKLTRIEQQEDKSYMIFFDEDFYKHFTQFYVKNSFFNILYRIFGLLPQDFYHYVGATYHAHYKPSSLIRAVHMLFKNKSDAINFANEIDRRLTYIIKKGDF